MSHDVVLNAGRTGRAGHVETHRDALIDPFTLTAVYVRNGVPPCPSVYGASLLFGSRFVRRECGHPAGAPLLRNTTLDRLRESQLTSTRSTRRGTPNQTRAMRIVYREMTINPRACETFSKGLDGGLYSTELPKSPPR